MKTQTKSNRKINTITPGRWTAYAAAAAASGFAATHTAEATIHYSGLINQNRTGNRGVGFQLDPAGGSIVLKHRYFFYQSHQAGGAAYFSMYGAQSASVVGEGPQPVFVSKLDRGFNISAGRFFSIKLEGILAVDYMTSIFDSQFGAFLDRGPGLIGFKFNNGTGDQYGWVRVKMWGGLKNTLQVVDYAYGDPGEPVFAGQKESNTSTPALETLGGLALGAAGLLALRKSRGSRTAR